MDMMNNHFCVPDFEMEGDCFMPASTSMSNKPAMMEDEMAELPWQDGEVVVQRSSKRTHGGGKAAILNGEEEARADAERIRLAAEETARQHMFMQEDELASWLHYPLDEPEPPFDHRRDFYNDFLYLPPFNRAPERESRTSAAEIRPEPPPSPPPPPAQAGQVDVEASTKLKNFMHFSRLPRAASRGTESGQSFSTKAAVEKESTAAVSTPRDSISNVAPNVGRMTMTSGEVAERSSPGGSSANVIANPELPPPQQPSTAAEDRKRKGREADDNDNSSVGIDEPGEMKKHAGGSTFCSKKSRAAEVHNLSERRRRDRINEKMRALQELIPCCSKSDKASMLDEAIEYLKSLQLQVQMMSMGYSMVPMMYPGVRHYMPMMGMGMGMGMGVDMGMNRPTVPYPHHLPSSAVPNPSAAAHMGQSFPMLAFHVPPVPVPDPSAIQASNASDSMLNSLVTHNAKQLQLPNFVDPYQQYLGLHQGQVLSPQNHAVVQPSSEKPSASRRVGNPENHQPG